MRLLCICALLASTTSMTALANVNVAAPTANSAGVVENTSPLPIIPTTVARGVMRPLVDKYDSAKLFKSGTAVKDQTFTCLDGSKTIPFARVNDEYCDCKDGSDEPGTAACSMAVIAKSNEWRFRCNDSGSQFKDRTFRHSQVNDGICDCCDGSDEYAGHVSCPNTCEALVEIEEKATREREEKRRLGLAAKKAMEDDAQNKIDTAAKSVVYNEAKVKEAEAKLEALRTRKENAEHAETLEKEALAAKHKIAEEAWKVEQQKKLSLPENLKPHWGCVRWAQTKECKGDGELDGQNRTCTDTIHGSASGFCVCRQRTPEYLAKIRAGTVDAKADQDSREAALAAEADKRKTDDGVAVDDEQPDADAIAANDDEVPEDDNINPAKYPEQFNRQQEDRLIGVVGEDTLIKRDCGHAIHTCESLCEYGGNEELKRLHEEKYHGDDGSHHQTEDAKAVREEWNTIENEKRDAENALAEAKRRLESLQKEDIALAFRAMDGLCYSKQLHNYKYKFCPFGKAEQDHTSLGTWKGFGEQTYSSWGAKHDFSVMKFENGQHCWGGPARSLTVRVVCGPTSEIMSVEEPSMCTYVIKFQSPAICE